MELDESKNYKFFKFDKELRILYHTIAEENCGTKDNFVLSMSCFITLIEKYRPKYLFIEILKKPSFFELELPSFMQKTLYPVIKEANVKKIACHLLEDTYLQDLKTYETDTSFVARFFTNYDEAQCWLLLE